MIRIVGLGPGSKDAMTLGTLSVLRSADRVLLRTEKHPTVSFIRETGITFETYDNEYERHKSFDEVYQSIALDLIEKGKSIENLVYAVPGHPLVAERSVKNLIDLCEENDMKYEILPAVSFVDAMMESLKIDPVNGIKIIDAFDMKNQVLDKRVGTVITQVYDKFIASEVKLALSEYYKDETEIYFVRAAGVKDLESIRKIHLYELDRQEDIDYLTSVYIPKIDGEIFDFNDLVEIMDELRGPDGCPWDREQTHESLKRYLIEECYEVLEAIDVQNDDMLIEELGDVLLQVVFHSQIGKEEGFFGINDVIHGICNKLITRHPHVFAQVKVNDSNDVLKNWDEIKKEEQGLKTHTDALRHVPKQLPGLLRADKVQRKAAKVGFDWDKVEDAMNKVCEELNEIKGVYKSDNQAKIVEEVGDLIFSTVNVARFLDIDPEIALNITIDKFIRRFEYIETKAIAKGYRLEELDLKAMDQLWEEAKNK